MDRTTVHTRFVLGSDSCADCAGDMTSTLGRLPGVQAVRMLTAVNAVSVEHMADVSVAQIREAAHRQGVELFISAKSEFAGARASWWRQRRFGALALAGALLLIGLLAERALEDERLATVLYFATLIVGGIYPVRSAFKALRARRLTISTLLVASAAGASALGVYEEGALLVVVFSLGEVLEGYASDRARGAIRALMQLAPRSAKRRAHDGSLSDVAVEELIPGDVIVVRPGERVPTDGTVASGASAVDQSPVTGESIPVEVATGSVVFAGTVNGNGALDVRVTKHYADTTLARIIRQVEEAQASKGRAERFADRFGAVYTPAMFVVAVIVAVVPFVFGGDFREWFYRALVVLTVSCSCALVMSVPISVVVAIARAARSGILIKGGAYLEALGTVRAVAFDKTGTLTEGRPRVTDVIPLNGWNVREALRVAAAIEAASEHPLAAAVTDAAAGRGIAITPAQDVKAIPGSGVEATVGGERWFIGKPGGPIHPDIGHELARLQTEGKTVVVLADSVGRHRAILAITDGTRRDAARAVGQLKAMGIQHLVMLTGDNERTAAAVARAVGIREWRAGLLPEQKTAIVRELQSRYGTVAMIGDGVNDAPALAAANVGVAMGAAGTDVALESADVALMADDLVKLPEAIRLARRALGNIRQNITLSLAAVTVLVVGALTGWLSLTTGLLLNEASALLIIGNGLRLLAGNASAMPHREESGGDLECAA